jgi:hypothetical protein
MPSSFKSLTVNDTGYFQFPNGTTTQRTSNTSTLVSAFTTVGSTTWTCPANVTVVEVLVVGGGGGGGCGQSRSGGGGGGGVVYNTSYPVTPTTVYTVVVGGGGAGQTNQNATPAANQGGSSQFDTLIAYGGGQGGNGLTGGYTTAVIGASGGSGGGGGGTGNVSYISPGGNGISGQGFGGGQGVHIYGAWAGGGGGGGAGGPGVGATIDLAGNGGPGVMYTISGSTVMYGAGGGGAYYTGSTNYGIGGTGVGGANGNNSSTGGTGPANTGSGGGASGATSGPGGAGTAGIVIIRYTLTSSNTDPRGETRFNTVNRALEVYGSNSKWKIAPTENPTTDGLILYLDAARYNPGSGTTWQDLSPAGSNATLVNGVTYTPASITNNGNSPAYFSLTGSSTQYITSTLTNPSGDWPHTIEVAVQWSSSQSSMTNKQVLFFLGSASTNAATACEILNVANAGINWYFYSNDVRYNTKDILQANQWYILTFVYQGGGSQQVQKQLYINGQFIPWDVTPSNLALNIGSNQPISIGYDLPRAGGPMTGKIGHFKVYNRPLNIQEVKANVNAHAARYGIQTVPDAALNSMPIVPGAVYNMDPGILASYPQGNLSTSDLTGNYQGAFANYPLYTNYNGSGTLQFNGSNTSIGFSTSGPITSYPFTVSIWAANFSSWVAGAGLMQELVNLSIGGQRVSLGISNNSSISWPVGPGIFYGSSNHWSISNANAGITATGSQNWHQLTWVVYGSNDANHQLYVDGRLVSMTNNGSNHGGSAGWNIGSNSASGEYWNGNIGQVLMYNRSLTQQEVQQNFNASRHRYGI